MATELDQATDINCDTEDHTTDPVTWLDRYGDLLYRVAIKRVGDAQTAEDLVQDTLLAAWQARDTFSGMSKESTWLIAILKRKVVDHFRRNWRQADLGNSQGTDDPIHDFIDSGDHAGHWNPDRAPGAWGENPETLMKNQQLKEALERCIGSLPKPLSIIYILKEIDGINTDDICRDFSLTSSNVWVMLHRARAGLRRCLEENWFSDSGKTNRGTMIKGTS